MYTWSDGSKYDGQWSDNRLEENFNNAYENKLIFCDLYTLRITGRGLYTWLDGRKYEGEWLNNNMHGKGVYTWRDGRKYSGDY